MYLKSSGIDLAVRVNLKLPKSVAIYSAKVDDDEALVQKQFLEVRYGLKNIFIFSASRTSKSSPPVELVLIDGSKMPFMSNRVVRIPDCIPRSVFSDAEILGVRRLASNYIEDTLITFQNKSQRFGR